MYEQGMDHRWLPGALLLFLLLGGCAANPPRGLEQDPPQAPSQRAVQADPQRHIGQAVRWGGEILGVRNRSGSTEIEVYGRPLAANAEPQPTGGEGVRFLARVAGFLDPAEYAVDKRITVRGRLANAVTREIGEYRYLYPVVDVSTHHLWPAYQPAPEPVGWRDPFYNPWWPWRPWGYYHHSPYWW